MTQSNENNNNKVDSKLRLLHKRTFLIAIFMLLSMIISIGIIPGNPGTIFGNHSAMAATSSFSSSSSNIIHNGDNNSTTTTILTRPSITSIKKINIVKRDLEAHYSDFGNIIEIGSAKIDEGYAPLSAFYNSNNTGAELPLMYVHPNGTLIRIIHEGSGEGGSIIVGNNNANTINNNTTDAVSGIYKIREGWPNYRCDSSRFAYCGFLPPYNLPMKGKLIYAVDLKWKAAATASNDNKSNNSNNGNGNIVSSSNNTNIDNNSTHPITSTTITTRPPEDIYAVDAITGEIVDSWFLRRTAVGDDVSKYYGYASVLRDSYDGNNAPSVTSGLKNVHDNSDNKHHTEGIIITKVPGLKIWNALQEGLRRLTAFMVSQYRGEGNNNTNINNNDANNSSNSLSVTGAVANPRSRALNVIISDEVQPRLSEAAYVNKIKQIIGLDIPVEIWGFGHFERDSANNKDKVVESSNHNNNSSSLNTTNTTAGEVLTIMTDKTVYNYNDTIHLTIDDYNNQSSPLNITQNQLKPVYAGMPDGCGDQEYFTFDIFQGNYSAWINDYNQLLGIKDKVKPLNVLLSLPNNLYACGYLLLNK